MKSKNPVNFQGIIDRKLQKNKNKTKRCDRSSKQLFIHTTKKKTRKQTNKTHLQQYYTLKTIERRLCLLGFVLIFCLCISEKFNQVSFKCHPWRSSPPLRTKNRKEKTRQIVDVWKKNQENENYFIGFIIYRPMPSSEKKRKKLFLAIHLFKKNKWKKFSAKLWKKNKSSVLVP